MKGRLSGSSRSRKSGSRTRLWTAWTALGKEAQTCPTRTQGTNAEAPESGHLNSYLSRTSIEAMNSTHAFCNGWPAITDGLSIAPRLPRHCSRPSKTFFVLKRRALRRGILKSVADVKDAIRPQVKQEDAASAISKSDLKAA